MALEKSSEVNSKWKCALLKLTVIMTLRVIVPGDYHLQDSATGWVMSLSKCDPCASSVRPDLNFCSLMLNISC